MIQTSPSDFNTKGFTLIEIMVVIVIIGIMSAVAALNVVSNDGSRLLKREVTRFKAVLMQALDEAVLQQRELGLQVSEDGYQFLSWDREEADPATVNPANVNPTNPSNTLTTSGTQQAALPKPAWQLIENSPSFGEHQLTEGIRIMLELEDTEVVKIVTADATVQGETELTRTNLNLSEIGPHVDENTTEPPDVYILSSGEMTPFTVEFFLEEDSDKAINVKGDELGRIVVDYGGIEL